MNVIIGATLDGGSTVALAPAGLTPGRSVFTSPDHTRLEPETVTFTTSQSTAKNGVVTGKAGLQLLLANIEEEEGCCTVKAGHVRVDLGLYWDLSQPRSVAEKALAYLRGVVYTDDFENLILKGITPSA